MRGRCQDSREDGEPKHVQRDRSRLQVLGRRLGRVPRDRGDALAPVEVFVREGEGQRLIRDFAVEAVKSEHGYFSGNGNHQPVLEPQLQRPFCRRIRKLQFLRAGAISSFCKRVKTTLGALQRTRASPATCASSPSRTRPSPSIFARPTAASCAWTSTRSILTCWQQASPTEQSPCTTCRKLTRIPNQNTVQVPPTAHTLFR